MKIQSYKTRVLNPPKDDLLSAIFESIAEIPENSILAVTSKVVSIWQGSCVPFSEHPDKDELIKQESEKYLERDLVPGEHMMHTIKDNFLIPSAGIDESKRTGYYILWPKNLKQTSKQLCDLLKEHYKVKNLGLIITDSRTMFLRRGVIGIAIGYAGFNPLKDYRLDPKLSEKNYSITQANHADGLASAAVAVMGEANEQTPLALITDIPFVDFSDPKPSNLPYTSFEVSEDEDLYWPFLKNVPWKKGGK